MFSRLLFLFLLTILLTILYTLYPIPSYAFTMEGGGFRLEVPDILGEKVQTGPDGQEPQTLRENPRIIRPAQSNEPFTFTVSTLLIDFGLISPTDPVTRTANFIVQSERTGFTVQAWQNHPLENPASPAGRPDYEEIIPDTTCDTGGCSVTVADSWINPLVYGSGFRADNVQGTSNASIFSSESFAQFADLEASESSSVLMSNNKGNWTISDEIRLTFKVNVAGNQKAGVYQNTIHYVAIPNF